MERFESGLLNELHEINKNLKSINRSLSLLTLAMIAEEKDEGNKDGGDTEPDNTV